MLSSTKPCVEDLTTWGNVHEKKTTKPRRVLSLRSFCRSLPRARVTEVRERPRTGPAHITALPAVRWSRGHRCGGSTARAAASSQCQVLTSPEPLRQAALDIVQPKFSHRATCHRTAQTSPFMGITALFLLSLFLLSS